MAGARWFCSASGSHSSAGERAGRQGHTRSSGRYVRTRPSRQPGPPPTPCRCQPQRRRTGRHPTSPKGRTPTHSGARPRQHPPRCSQLRWQGHPAALEPRNGGRRTCHQLPGPLGSGVPAIDLPTRASDLRTPAPSSPPGAGGVRPRWNDRVPQPEARQNRARPDLCPSRITRSRGPPPRCEETPRQHAVGRGSQCAPGRASWRHAMKHVCDQRRFLTDHCQKMQVQRLLRRGPRHDCSCLWCADTATRRNRLGSGARRSHSPPPDHRCPTRRAEPSRRPRAPGPKSADASSRKGSAKISDRGAAVRPQPHRPDH